MHNLVAILFLILPLTPLLTRNAAGESVKASEGTPDARLQIVQRLAPRVHVLRTAEPAFAGNIGNVTVIEQRDGLVMIDSGVSYGSGARIVALVRSISPKPVKAVVITHWHNDHTLGLPAILAAWPSADIIAHEQTLADMTAGRLGKVPRARSQEYETRMQGAVNRSFEQIETEAAARRETPEERRGWGNVLAARQQRIDDLAGTYLVLPRRTFSDRLTLPDRDAPIELMALGRAHTSGDVSAWLPKQRIFVAGDVVVAPAPYMFNVYPTEMLAVFDRIRALRFRILVPGHGEPQFDGSYLDKLIGLIRDMQRQISPLARQNIPLTDSVGRIDLDSQRIAFAGSNAWLGYWVDNYTLTPLVASVYREARGEPLGPPPIQP